MLAPQPHDPPIIEIRGQSVMLDVDLAAAYGVLTKALNQAVKRNWDRFPADFVFRLNSRETKQALRSRSQSVTLKRGQNVKYLPWAFTEHGALMAATVLNSPRRDECLRDSRVHSLAGVRARACRDRKAARCPRTASDRS
jgi:hypothetical protein